MNPRICNAITETSIEVFNWLSKQNEVGEESITDWALYNANKLEGRIQYHQFNRHEEGKVTGADFELWIISSTLYFKSRVQAKRLRPDKDLYPSIAHSNRHGMQIDKLISDARNGGFRPLYAFYNHENHQSKCRWNKSDQGIYLADALKVHTDVFGASKRPISSSDLIRLSVPFSCWFCCGLYKEKKHLTFPDFFNEYYNKGNDDEMIGFTQKMPGYVEELLRFSDTPRSFSDEDEYDLQKKFPILKEVNGLIVINLREK